MAYPDEEIDINNLNFLKFLQLRDKAIANNIVNNDAHTPIIIEFSNKYLLSKRFKFGSDKCHIINCARGGLIIEEDLIEALNNGHVSGAALDVFNEEPPKNNKLFDVDNLILTPHLGASTAEAQENVAIQVAQQISDYLNNGVIVNSINVSPISLEEKQILLEAKSLDLRKNKIAEILSTYTFDEYHNTTIQ